MDIPGGIQPGIDQGVQVGGSADLLRRSGAVAAHGLSVGGARGVGIALRQ